MRMRIAIALMLAAQWGGTAMSQVISSAEGQQALLRSPDPKVAANKKLVYDMYREIVQGGHAELVDKYFTVEYIQHNPNITSGRDALAAFLRGSRPARPVEPTIIMPLINIIGERDYVVVVTEKPMKDEKGEPYTTSWFDFFRIENGRIAEHWDPALKTAEMLRFDPYSITKPKAGGGQ